MIRTSLKRKRHQQLVNKYVRATNKSLREDNVWRGRFEIRQIHSDFYIFDDKSGAYLICYFEIIDKLTHKARMTRIEENSFLNDDIYYEINDFICNDIVAPIKYEGDFRNITIPVHSFRFWRNHMHQVVEV